MTPTISVKHAICFAATVFVVLCYLGGLPGVEGRKCWVCRSDADPRCQDPFDNSTAFLSDCSIETLPHRPGLEATMCRKTRQKVNGHWRFIRSCAFLGTPGEGHGDENYCLMRTGTYNVFIETCTCHSKDGCNSSNSLDPSFWGVAVLFVFFILVSKTPR